MTIRVAVDAMGSDRGPEDIVAGAVEAATDQLQPVIVGPSTLDTQGLELIEAPDVIEMDEKPTEAVRAKERSSLVIACRAVGDGRANAVVSPGNTGAMLAASLLHIRRVKGVLRPAIAVVIPARDGPNVLIDAGANADARPEHLAQFAEMGTILSREVLGVASPRVRLLSIGEEAEKGNQLALDAHALLAQRDGFEGNTEGRNLLTGGGEVVVTDGFTGNVALKLLEGTIRAILDGLRTEITATTRGKLGGLLIRPAARRLRTRLDPDTYGGAYLLGLRGLAVIAHGNSSSRAIANAIRLAARGVEHDVVGRLAQRLQEEVLESARSTPTTPE
ncbi:MAG: phosphate acyltransferase PlsX [Actinobacteria bacterium]|nr:MAG: phosphate acyltransferase PlsX [Actinomycetota bacterium]